MNSSQGRTKYLGEANFFATTLALWCSGLHGILLREKYVIYIYNIVPLLYFYVAD